MKNILKESLIIYKENFWKILVIGCTFVLPIQFLYSFFANYVSFPFHLYGIPLWTNLIQIFLLLIVFCLFQLPFISIVTQDRRFEEVKLTKVYEESLIHMFSVYMISIIYAFLVVAGVILFVIPGIILLILFISISQAAIIENRVWFSGLKRAFQFGKERFFRLVGLLSIFTIVDLFISGAGYFMASEVTNSVFITNLTLMVINMLYLPLFFFSASFLYIEWKEKRNKIAVHSEHQQSFRRTYS